MAYTKHDVNIPFGMKSDEDLRVKMKIQHGLIIDLNFLRYMIIQITRTEFSLGLCSQVTDC